MVAPAEALAAGWLGKSQLTWKPRPLLCAGITTYNALRHSGAL